MVSEKTGCMVCGSPLVYSNSQMMMECDICHRTVPGNARCAKGHFICDACHSEGSMGLIRRVCLRSTSKDPMEILLELMDVPGVHMHGPEHHTMVGHSIITAYRNCGGDIDLEESLIEMEKRSKQVPGGACGMWGACGAAISSGIAYSIISGTTPLSGETWGLCNRLTSECLLRISEIGGPRCCKRDSFTCILAASRFISEHDGIEMRVGKSPICRFSSLNAQCIGDRCPYHK